MITFIHAYYNQNSYLYMYAYICHPKVFTFSPHILTAISVHHSLINNFLPTTPRNDSEILVSLNSEQDVCISNISPKISLHGDSAVYKAVPHSNN